MTAKKGTKKRDAVLFCKSKPIVFCRSCCRRRPRRSLSSLILSVKTCCGNLHHVMTEYWLRKLISAALYLTITIKLLRKLKRCVLSYLTFLTVNSKEPIAAEAHITVFLVQRHTSSIIFAWRAFTRTLWKSDWDIKNAWKISPHFIS